MKSFVRPYYEVVRLSGDVITTSSTCGCVSGDVDWTEMGFTNETCFGANVACGCSENQSPAVSNCV